MKYVLPVVHYHDYETTMSESKKAMSLGADGVFLISHGYGDESLFEPAVNLMRLYPDKHVGLNLLGSSAYDSLLKCTEYGINYVWADSPGVSSLDVTDEALLIAEYLKEHSHLTFFGSVAFKYQKYEPEPAMAAKKAIQLGMLPTTSGSGTGQAPNISKIKSMHNALGVSSSLAIASGMTPENVSTYLPYISHFLVSTGVSYDAYHFDDKLLSEFIKLCKA